MPSQIDFEKAHGNDGHIELAGLRWAARAPKVTDSMANSVWQRQVLENQGLERMRVWLCGLWGAGGLRWYLGF